MGETENRMILERLYDRVWIGDTHDFNVMDEVFAADAVVEYPQSGERMRGRANIRAVEENYPGLPKVTIRRRLVIGELALVESELDYQGKALSGSEHLRVRGRQGRSPDPVLPRALRGSGIARSVDREDVDPPIA